MRGGGVWVSHILNGVLFSLGKDTHRGSPEDHTLGEITKGCVIPRSGWVLSCGSSFHGVPRAANPQWQRVEWRAEEREVGRTSAGLVSGGGNGEPQLVYTKLCVRSNTQVNRSCAFALGFTLLVFALLRQGPSHLVVLAVLQLILLPLFPK